MPPRLRHFIQWLWYALGCAWATAPPKLITPKNRDMCAPANQRNGDVAPDCTQRHPPSVRSIHSPHMHQGKAPSVALALVPAVHTGRHAHTSRNEFRSCTNTPLSVSSCIRITIHSSRQNQRKPLPHRCIRCTHALPRCLALWPSHAAAAAYACVVRSRAHPQQASGAHGEGVEGTQHQPRVGEAVGAAAKALVVTQWRSGSGAAVGVWGLVPGNDWRLHTGRSVGRST